MCICHLFLSLLRLCLLPTRVGYIFAFFLHGLLNMWEGICTFWFESLGKALLFSLSCALAALLSWLHIVTYTKYEVITGPLERLLSKAMYQMFCFRSLQNSEDITPHYFPEKLLLTLKIIFMGCIVFLYLLMLWYCFLMLTSLDSPLCFSSRKFTNSLCSLLF